MPHTILSIAYPLTQVGPDAVGGSEQILYLLDRALTRRGHRSIVIAAEGSTVEGTLIPSPPAKGALNDAAREWGREMHAQLIRETLQRYSVDLVHMHSLDFHAYIPAPPVPVLATLHLPADWYPKEVYRTERPNLFLNCVSTSQQGKCPGSRLFVPPVSNGIDVETFGTLPKRNYVAALGRICPEKGFHLALDAAKKARVEMVLAGEVFSYASHTEYYKRQIVPRLNQKRRFIGPVGIAGKRRVLAEARCLLIPSLVAETSSLVAMEALASGTPVVAFRAGALPEIIEHGKTGFLVDDINQMAKAIRAADDLDPETCRSVARARFSSQRMVQSYFEMYAQMIDQSTLREADPVRTGSSWLFAWQ